MHAHKASIEASRESCRPDHLEAEWWKPQIATAGSKKWRGPDIDLPDSCGGEHEAGQPDDQTGRRAEQPLALGDHPPRARGPTNHHWRVRKRRQPAERDLVGTTEAVRVKLRVGSGVGDMGRSPHEAQRSSFEITDAVSDHRRRKVLGVNPASDDHHVFVAPRHRRRRGGRWRRPQPHSVRRSSTPRHG